MQALSTTYQQARRTNRSGGLVQAAGDLGLLAAFCFWAWVLWGFIKPQFTTAQAGVTPESLITGAFLAAFAIILALCCAVVMPALCAAIFPHTAAAQYLQEIRRSAWGFWLLATSCAILVIFTIYILLIWWRARLSIPDPSGLVLTNENLARALTTMTTIFFVVVPSWAANYGSPILWLTEVQQAHQVAKLKLTHQQDIAMAKAAYRRALNILKMGLDNATIEQREYVAKTLIGLHQAERSLMLDIASTLNEDARLEEALPAYDDPGIVRRYGEIHEALVMGTPALHEDAEPQRALAVPDEAGLLERARGASGRAKPREAVRRDVTPPHHVDLAHRDAPNDDGEAMEYYDEEAAYARDVQEGQARKERDDRAVAAHWKALNSSAPAVAPSALPDDATRRHNAARSDGYAVAKRALRDAWTVRDLARVLAIEESTARARKAEWQRLGRVTGRGLPNGRYIFTEYTEVAQ